MRENEPTVTFQNVTCLKETEKALKCMIDGEEHWIPKSHVHPDSEVFDDESNAEGKLVVSEWISKEKNLV